MEPTFPVNEDIEYLEALVEQWNAFEKTIVWKDVIQTTDALLDQLNTDWQEGKPGAENFAFAAAGLRRVPRFPEYARERLTLAKAVRQAEERGDEFLTDMEVMNRGGQ